MKLLRSFGATLVIFTRIPCPLALDAADLRRGVWHLPLLGIFYGLLQWALALVLPWGPAANLTACLLLALPVLIGGGLHEDGFADFCDALGGGGNSERRLAIMKDPRLGSFALLGSIGLFSFQFFSLQAIDPLHLGPALILSQATARGLALFLIARLPYVQQGSSRAGSYLPSPGLHVGLGYGLLCSAASWLLAPGWKEMLGIALGMLLLQELWRRYLWAVFAGYTGDCLGAAIKLTETVLLLAATLWWPR